MNISSLHGRTELASYAVTSFRPSFAKIRRSGECALSEVWARTNLLDLQVVAHARFKGFPRLLRPVAAAQDAVWTRT